MNGGLDLGLKVLGVAGVVRVGVSGLGFWAAKFRCKVASRNPQTQKEARQN